MVRKVHPDWFLRLKQYILLASLSWNNQLQKGSWIIKCIYLKGRVCKFSKVSWRIIYEYVKLVGIYYDNLMLNTLMYDVEFPDSATKPYAYNTIDENIHNSVDSDVHWSITFGETVNYCKTANAVAIADATVVGRNGRRYQRKTTAGWNLLIGMKDGSEQWYPLKDMR